MARAYTVATIGLALGVDSKWVDNILSRFAIRGVVQSRQGVSRRISTDGVVELATVQMLTDVLRVPIEVAVKNSGVLAETGELYIGCGLRLVLDRTQQLIDLEVRLEYAVEATPVPKRGRPPRKTKRGAN